MKKQTMVVAGILFGIAAFAASSPFNDANSWKPLAASQVTISQDTEENAIAFQSVCLPDKQNIAYPICRVKTLAGADSLSFELKFISPEGLDKIPKDGTIVLGNIGNVSGSFKFNLSPTADRQKITVPLRRDGYDFSKVGNVQIMFFSPQKEYSFLIRDICLRDAEGKEFNAN